MKEINKRSEKEKIVKTTLVTKYVNYKHKNKIECK